MLTQPNLNSARNNRRVTNIISVILGEIDEIFDMHN